jgi:hypothetical protein
VGELPSVRSRLSVGSGESQVELFPLSGDRDT